MRNSNIAVLADYEHYRSALEEELKAVFSSREGILYDVLRYHFGWTDERGTPEDNPTPCHFPSLLALACCEAVSGDFRPALPAAAGIELVHNFTLVHGDVQSGRPETQDRPSIWWVWGPAQAINAGDGLHALGRTTIMRLAQRGVPAELVLRAVESLDRACLTLCEGQYMDLEFQDQLLVTEAAYFDMITRKTGSLTGCAAETGSLAAGGSLTASFFEMGKQMGLAWQISRDVSDLWGDRGDGMTASNVLNKKKSLPLIHTLEKADLAVKRDLGSLYSKRVLEPEDAARLVDILEQANARRFAQEKAAQLLDQGLESLREAGLSAGAMDNLGRLGKWALQGAG